MELHSVFVTGGNRGIGLEFVRQLVQFQNPPKFVFASYRSQNGIEPLEEVSKASKNTQVILIKMDTTKLNEITAARKIVEDTVGDKGLTLLINNAGVCVYERFPEVTEENLLYHLKTNTVGPTLIIQEFLPLLQKSAALRGKDSKMEVSRAAVVNISAGLGSITHVKDIIAQMGEAVAFSYAISKAAVNMMARIVASKVKDQGILVVSMCPGWVKTDMGSQIAELEVKDSISAMLSTLSRLDESHHGEFMDRNGSLYKF